MAEVPVRKAVLDLSTVGGAETDIYLGDLGAATSLSVQCSWSGLDATDGWVTQVMTEDKNLNWVLLESIKTTMDSASGACVLTNEDYVCKYAAIRVNPGSCTVGTVTIAVTQKRK